MDDEYPLLQMVDASVAWLTCGFNAPGVQWGSGSGSLPRKA
jgi:hypothetical protein